MKIKFIGLLAFGTCLLLNACSDGENKETSDESTEEEATSYAAAEDTPCDCQSDWFEDGMITAPLEEGAGSPFHDTSTTNCDFHQWSWHKFLYLTQVETGNSLPYFLTSMNQVTSEMDPVAQPNDVIVLTENVQAGGVGAMVNSNSSYWNGSDTVYYSIHISEEFQTAADEFQAKIEANSDSANNRWSFPVGSVELKVSWANANTISSSDINDYYTTQAEINGQVLTVALLGMHVVGVVENHPEFVWATFENNNLAPKYDWETTVSTDVPVTSPDANLALFKEGDAANLADITWTSGQSLPDPNNVFSIYEYGTPQVPGGGFLEGTSQNTPEENYNNIDNLNNSVHDSLTTWGIDLWTNYFYDGSIWMNMDNLSHEQQIDTILDNLNNFGKIYSSLPFRGSLAAANVSMETYEQTKSVTAIHDMGLDSIKNCFTCHSPSSYLPIGGVQFAQSPIYLSHIFMNHMNEVDPDATLDKIREQRRYLFQKFQAKK